MDTQTQLRAAADRAYSMPLEQIDPSDPTLQQDDTHAPYFARLREEDPIHHTADSLFGPFWSVTRYDDIMHVEMNPQLFSSDSRRGGIIIMDSNAAASLPMFIAMDPPKHDEQRKVVSPVVAPENLARMSGLIRQRTADTLDSLPINQTFDWVPSVSINLTTKMLATLFDFPFEERQLLTYWSDVTTALPGTGVIDSEEHRMAELGKCSEYFLRLWNERVNAEPKPDLISMLAHSEKTRNMPPDEYLGNVLLLIVGGNDTTRNTMSGSVLALNRFPDEYRKLCANPQLLESTAVPEFVRWQTPLAHMRRTATQDTELHGKRIRAGEKVVMWYVSSNREPGKFNDPGSLQLDRENARQHQSFGFGIHRCVGNRLAELQVRILWEEILKRWPEPGQIEVIGEPQRLCNPFVRGYSSLPVRINA
ncbi:cytochrome P450 [Algiphilus sp. W345]|uniref:Cytochrome P450 n=1 Tax=Banduia mediterranea TaxID=3075609 RepID=A0ABU2WE56_9GAMM|nr:cytochrome P450 [Algiphilus sp. W345]MDT0496160.1 cytochrome P450 [Algiphilus sp. W345]